MTNPTPTSEADNSVLFRALRSADADESLSFHAVEETRKMAGVNHAAEISVLKAEINGNFRTIEAKFEGVSKQITGLYVYITVVLAILGFLIKS